VKRCADRTLKPLELLQRQRPAPGTSRQQHLWAVQHARAIHQMAEGYSYDMPDEAEVTEMMEYRDRVMAENTAWWHRHTGDRILLSVHNTHVWPARATTSWTCVPLPAPCAPGWPPRPTWNIGAGWPDPTEYRIALGKAHDILIHLEEVEATTYLGNP
jgi:hypothetical protein